ncbi:SusC/RagA family TonB-linked outer membrane protein [uncultured Acetobacteroides sp.]|uniref:SusC/RagA family TonB-linked outer membrane protein n=1 Tax=uncultured Acetobacteroides sp. TaxID=1760811 RepID=UPI0029F56A6D|nr:SusC/RagA family TonB-linked outer membrane protein [uncultured Acetobacteroides sp.]
MKKIALLLILLWGAAAGFAQQVTVLGHVADRKNNPLLGATVSVVEAPAVREMVDSTGGFKISATIGNKLIISKAGVGLKYVKITSADPLSVVLDYRDEVVLLPHGVERRAEELTGAISVLKSEELMKSSSLNLSNALFGNILGLSALQNGGVDWENNASLFVRGSKTLSNNSLLVVVDGLERSIDNIVLDEVESVEVLRDAAAVARYGFRGINGVLAVTTKRGQYNSKSITFRYDHGFKQPVRLPEFANSYRYANAINEARANDGLSPRYNAYEVDAFKNGTYPGVYPNVDWFDEVLKDWSSTNIYSLSFKGGGKNARYFTVLNLETSDGLLKNADANSGYSTQLKSSKGNVRTNFDIDLTSTTALQVNILGILGETNRPGTHQSTLMDQLYSVPSAAFPVRALDGKWGGDATWTNQNPVANSISTGYARSQTRALQADVKLTEKLNFITPGLSASLRVGYDNYTEYWESKTKGFNYSNNVIVFDQAGNPIDTTTTVGGKVSQLNYTSSLGVQSRRLNIVTSVDYEKVFGESKFGASIMHHHDHLVNSGRDQTYNRENISGSFNYGYANRYFADLVLMASGSNRLKGLKEWAFSPTISAAWVLSNENFLKDSKLVNFLKLRASAGIINTDYVPELDLGTQAYVGGSSYYLGDSPQKVDGWKVGRTPTANPTTEKAYKYNVGVDAMLLNSLQLTADCFFERRSDIFVITGGQNTLIYGAFDPYANDGKVDSKGVELGLDYAGKVGRDFSWFAGAKYTFSRSKIVESLETPQPYDYLKRTGKSISQLFGYQVLGMFKDQQDIDNSPRQTLSAVKPGDFKYKDQNGDGVIDALDMVAMGYNTVCPEIYYSFNIGAEYKGFGFSAILQGVGNYSALLNTKSVYKPLIGNSTISNDYYENRWTPTNLTAKYPRLTTVDSDNNFANNSTWIADRSFVKLRNCEVYYSFPKQLLSKIKLNTAKIYVRGVDLLCFDNLDIVDPESYGVNYPTLKSYHVGLSIGF